MAAAIASTENMISNIAHAADVLPLAAGHTMAPTSLDQLIAVQAMWNGWRTALVPARDLENVHWFKPVGAPRALLHAEVSCAVLPPKAVPHECDPASYPHRLMVCIIKNHVTAGVYDALARLAGERPV